MIGNRYFLSWNSFISLFPYRKQFMSIIWVRLAFLVGKNDRQTRGTATAITDACRDTSTDDPGITFMDKQIYGSTSKDACRSMCMDCRGSTCTDISIESTDVHGSTCPYIYTKGAGLHWVTSMDDSTINTAVRVRNNTYD